MSFPFSYRPHGDEVLERLRQFYEERSQEVVLARMDVPNQALATFLKQYPPGRCDYPDPQERLGYWDAFLLERSSLRDDSVPCAALSEMDQGLFGGLLGGDVWFLSDERGFISSMVSPLLNDLTELDTLSFRTDCKWYQRYVNQLRVFVKGAKGKFGIAHLVVINGLNFVFELVGATKTYLNLDEHPNLIRRAIDLGFEINASLQDTYFEEVPLVEGGTCSFSYQWIPGRIIPESVDPFHMTSVDYFEKWGRAPMEKIYARFDGGVTHIHGNGRHLVEAVCSVKGLKGLLLLDDGDVPPAFEVLGELKKRTGNTPLICTVAFGDFERALMENDLIGGVMYKVTDVPDVDTANRCMDLVRKYRA